MNKNNTPLVSICTLVYNHGPYLRECFEGFLMQKTNFAFEVLVHDDASTDNSAEIIREYTEKYPDIFKPIYQTENQYSKGIRICATHQFPRATGKYIAMCEGDDYWTDPLKLQKQVDFLEAHSDYAICSHNFKIFVQKENIFKEGPFGSIPGGIHYDLKSLVSGNWYNYTQTIMFRTEMFCLEDYRRCANSKDATLAFFLLKKGKGYLMPDEMAVYRIHSGGIWSCVGYGNQLTGEIKSRLGIYDIDPSYEAAFFIRSFLLSDLPISWILRERELNKKCFKIIYKHFGLIFTLKLLLKKIVPTKIKYYIKKVLKPNSIKH